MIGDFSPRPDWAALHEYEGLMLHRDVSVAELAELFHHRLVYLATPYALRATDESGRWSLDRSFAVLGEASAWSWRLTRAGLSVVAPVMLSAQMLHDEYAAERSHDDAIGPFDHAGWEAWCRPMLAAAQVVAIAPLEGWDRSLGVWRETVAALGAMKSVCVLEGA